MRDCIYYTLNLDTFEAFDGLAQPATLSVSERRIAIRITTWFGLDSNQERLL